MLCSGSESPQWPQLWAKTNRDKTNPGRAGCRYHPLLYHMLDVAAVAGLVWDDCLTPQLRKRLEGALGTATRTQIVFLSGAHDLGKASPGFQKKVPVLSQNFGLPFSEYDQDRPHGFISAHVLKEALGCCTASAVLVQIAGGHHGVFPRSADLRMGGNTLGNRCWSTARHGLLQEFANIVGFDFSQAAQSRWEITDPAVVPILAGFISVVDWIGSNQDFFPCAIECGSPVATNGAYYWTNAQNQAQEALERLGWLPAVEFAEEAQFDGVFGFDPNALQQVAIELASKQTSPYLMIVEAPMGQGKTEAALYSADLAMCRGFARGMYIAMPTQATGSAMFKRVLDDYLRKRGHQGKLNLQLVHGDAPLAQMAEVKEGEVPEFRPDNIGDGGDVEAQSWFTARKRPLLAPFGVGTIDQSLLSVLQTKHWFVRLFGLAGKVVIFDEVHAYDAYMSTILERLLHWLAEVDCIVILLSATLPEARRKALATAYSGREDGAHVRYPRITLARPRHYPNVKSDVSSVCAPIPMGESQRVALRFATTDLPTLTAALRQQMGHGGCAAVICNTVDRAIEVYEHLRDSLKDTDTECSLFHARTLRMWRREREEEVLRKFGKGEKQADGTYANPDRPGRAVLVATQVIEQSLDLDFDLMVSEIAPIDLLLQRCGRLHRHPRHRPAGLEQPQLIVLCDATASGPPPESFNKDIEFVYDRYILLRTWLALRERKQIDVPAEMEALVEVVYGESTLACGTDWNVALEQARARMEDNRRESEKAADKLLVRGPRCACDLIEEFNDQLADDDDPHVHKTLRAATREGDPSITVVMAPADTVLTADPDVSAVRSLLDRSAKLSHKGIFQWLRDHGERPKEWAANAHLRHARLLRLDGRGQGPVGDHILRVDEELGVVIEKDGGNNG
ncbi:MAG: CRISPR-associated helicase Cas3' [Dehalococcoidales bacterium]|nr:CRISPR-associated helicase Cas3' [Dehalococcoidales bacterium]